MLFQVWRVCVSSFFALGAKCVAKSPIFGMKNWVRECWQTTMKCQIQWLGVRRADHWKLASDPNTSSTWTSKLPIEEQFLFTSDHMQSYSWELLTSVTYLATSLVMSKRNMTYWLTHLGLAPCTDRNASVIQSRDGHLQSSRTENFGTNPGTEYNMNWGCAKWKLSYISLQS